MRVRFSDLALTDLEEIATYIAHDSENAARHVIRGIESVCFSLREFPELGVRSKVSRARMLFVPGLPYKVVYEIARAEKAVIILRVYHDARDSRY